MTNRAVLNYADATEIDLSLAASTAFCLTFVAMPREVTRR